MRKLILAALYTAFALGANPAAAVDLAPLLTGEMEKLVPGAESKPLPVATLIKADGGEASLSDYKGKWVVLNFWATWCAPCRREMPSLDRLQAVMPGIAVVPVAAGRNDPERIDKFYAEAGVKLLPVLRDPKSQLARPMGVLGLPVTVIINPEGQEVARLIGGAEWDSPEALAVLKALIAG